MKKYALNTRKPNNYMFIDKQSGLFLSLGKRIGVVKNSTPSLERAVRCKTIIDITEEEKIVNNKNTQEEIENDNKLEQADEKPKKTRKKKQE